MTNFDLTYQKALPPFVFQNEKNMSHYDANLVKEEADIIRATEIKSWLIRICFK